jgi:hypothetical protein
MRETEAEAKATISFLHASGEVLPETRERALNTNTPLCNQLDEGRCRALIIRVRDHLEQMGIDDTKFLDQEYITIDDIIEMTTSAIMDKTSSEQ